MRLPRIALPLAAALALVLIVVSLPARASDPPAAQVTIVPPGGAAPRTVALADVPPDVVNRDYELRDADGTTRTVTVASGVSLGAVLGAAGIDLSQPGFDFLQLAGPDGTGVLVLGDEVGSDPPPAFSTDADGLHFVRPPRDEHDENALDALTLPDGAASVELRTGKPYVVRAEATPIHAKANQPVAFDALLAVGKATSDIGFNWYFDGTGTAKGAHVTHRFKHAGDYLVLVNVTKHGAQLDLPPGTIAVHVAQRRRKPVHRTSKQRRQTSSGAVGVGGGGGVASGGGGASGGGSATTGGATSGTTTGAGTGASTRRRATKPRRAPRRAQLPTFPHFTTTVPQGETVTGTLIASADAVPLPPGGLRGAAPAGAAEEGAGRGPLNIPAGVWVGLGLLAVVALGWALEARHTTPHWTP